MANFHPKSHSRVVNLLKAQMLEVLAFILYVAHAHHRLILHQHNHPTHLPLIPEPITPQKTSPSIHNNPPLTLIEALCIDHLLILLVASILIGAKYKTNTTYPQVYSRVRRSSNCISKHHFSFNR